MIFLPSGTRIWLVAGITDMRKSFNGLGELVQHALDENPFSGHLFIFRGRKGDTVKILWADADGLCLFTKRLPDLKTLPKKATILSALGILFFQLNFFASIALTGVAVGNS